MTEKAKILLCRSPPADETNRESPLIVVLNSVSREDTVLARQNFPSAVQSNSTGYGIWNIVD